MPGAGDSADASGADITFESGSVMELQGESATFDVEGPFSTGSLQGNETIVGGGTLSASTVVASLEIEGGYVSANSFASSETSVDSGGSLTVSGSLKDHRYLECSGTGSTISAPGGMDDVGMIINAGGQVTAGSIMNLLGSSSTIQGSGAIVSVTGDFDLAEGATLEMYSGASLQVNGKLLLDGGTNTADGGATWSDPGTTAQVDGTLAVGVNAGSFFMNLLNGAQVTSGAAFIGENNCKEGYVTMSGTNTIWHVQTGGMVVGADTNGYLTINTGAGLSLAGGAFAVGFLSGSSGTLVLDGEGSFISVKNSPLSIGYESGSQGSAQIQVGSAMSVGSDFYVGDGGVGNLQLTKSANIYVTGSSTQFGIGHQTGSTGFVGISAGGNLLVEGHTTIGDAGNGTLQVSDDGQITTSGTTVGNSSGTMGQASVFGFGSLWNDTNDFVVAAAAGGSGTVTVGSQGSLQTHGNCYIGGSGNASVTIESGATWDIQANPYQSFVVGRNQGSTGVITVRDSGSFFGMTGLAIVGLSGKGSVVLTNGATGLSGILELGVAPTSGGALIIDGSTWTSLNNVFVGGLPNAQPAGTGNIYVQNSGTMRLGPLLYLSPSGVVTLDPTAQIAVGPGLFGLLGTLRVTSGGMLFGKGRVQGQVVVAAGGVILPGDSPGILTIDGNFQEEAGGEMDIVIGGDTAGSNFSQLNITGTATLGGTLNVVLTNGFVPAPGQTFSILNAAGVSGTFSRVNGASISYGPTGATLSNVTGATGVPQLSIQLEGQNVVVTWPETVQGYSLQASTTLASNSWSTVTAEENTYVAPATNAPAFFRLIQ
jgi:T5SS/PEP-CTERM-associated repeat protein